VRLSTLLWLYLPLLIQPCCKHRERYAQRSADKWLCDTSMSSVQAGPAVALQRTLPEPGAPFSHTISLGAAKSCRYISQ
jgi:hypothetical protein